MDITEGVVLAGKYRVERVLGRGGMGVVVAATHLQLDQRVALKFLLPEALQHPEMLARFSREARAAAKLRSEHVAKVVDVGTLESGVPYIVMEYLEGGDLSSYLAKEGPLSVARAAELALEACEGLAEAHALGIVHRDLKPANLFLARMPGRTECLKILDFGISKVVTPGQTGFNMTHTGAVMGSPYYMSPEQMRSSRTVDVRADVWSLGVILFELVSGRVPFDAPSLPQLCGMILSEPAPALGQWRADAPPRFQALVSRCLEKEPSARFQSVAELAVALSEFAPAASARSVERILRLSGGAAAIDDRGEGSTNDRSVRTDWGRTSARASRSRSVWGAVTAFALVAGVASWALWHKATAGREHDGASAANPPRPTIPASAPPADAVLVPSASASDLGAPPTDVLTPAEPSAAQVHSAPAPAPSNPAAPSKHTPAPKRAPVPSVPTANPAPAPAPAPAANPLDGRM
jgi:serine/threonine-protein kinase